MSKLKDIGFLQMCYALAEKARGWTSPNPYVGAVVTKNNAIMGHGYHERPGTPHAEIVALQRAGQLARDGTIYLNLEPCTHWGRTPPCVNEIIQSKVKRVVISAYDPNPLVFKSGVKALRQSGIDVSVGLLERKNSRLNEIYLKYITEKIPFVTLKAAMSLDGKTATKNHDSRWISSPATREYIHLVRGEYDAIMVGIKTIVKDDPELTVRHANWKEKYITRIILDSQLRVPLNARILKTLPQGNILVFTQENVSEKKIKALQKKGIQVVSLSGRQIQLKRVLEWLGEHEITSVLVEGGGILQTSFLEQGFVDKILITISPKLIGGENAHTFFQGEGIQSVKDSLQVRQISSFQIEDDIIIEGYFQPGLFTSRDRCSCEA